MSDLEDSCEIIPGSPVYYAYNNLVIEKPKSRDKDLSLKRDSANTSVEDSDIDIIENSIEDTSNSCLSILEESSDISLSYKSSHSKAYNAKPSPYENLKRTNQDSLKKLNNFFDNSRSVNDIKNSTFDPSTPEGQWRTRKLSISDDESPIANFEKGRRYGIIDSDSEEDEPEILDDSSRSYSKDMHKCPNELESKHEIENKSGDSLLEKSILTNDSYGSIASFGSYSGEQSLDNASKVIKEDNSLISRKDENDSAIDNSKKYLENSFKRADSPEKERRFSSNQSSSSRANVSSSSSCSSLNLSNMSQSEIETKLSQNKRILKTTNINALPDKGARIKEKINEMNNALMRMNLEKKSGESFETHRSEKEENNSFKFTQQKPVSLSSGQDNKSLQEPTTAALYDSVGETKDKITCLKEQLIEKQMLYKAANLRSLPDGGVRLKEAVAKLEREIMLEECKANIASKFKRSEEESAAARKKSIEIITEVNPTEYKQIDPPGLQVSALVQALGNNKNMVSKETLFGMNQDYGIRSYKGKLSEAAAKRMIRMTSDAVESLHKILKSMPDVDVVEEDQPQGLRVSLMPHQKRALAWMLWREAQIPPGGILADDMGLGKTLTMLSLILKHNELVERGYLVDELPQESKDSGNTSSDDEGDRWIGKNSRRRLPLLASRGTLIVCPASLIGQWETESKKHISKNMIKLLVYHGNQRDVSLKRLAQHDVVVTTYQLVMREAFSHTSKVTSKTSSADSLPEIDCQDQGPLYRINWARIVLDEAHQIRNHRSKTSQAVSMLRGWRRWAVTGTPVQNKENDLFSIIRFLRLSPFDDFACWKHQLTGSAHGMRKLNLIIRTLLLRRNKDQVDQKTGEALVTLPPKETLQHMISLSQEEREVYDRVFSFSRSSLIQYMKSQEEKEREKAKKSGYAYEQPAELKNYDEGKYTPTLSNDILKTQDLKTHHILILLLRLRQICSHPALIHSILESEAKTTDALTTDLDPGADLVDQINQLSLGEKENSEEEFDNRIKDKVLTEDNPVFRKKRPSSKIAKVMEELQRLNENKEGEKAVIVSQWTSMLEIVHKHLRRNGFKSTAITGSIPVKDRQFIVDEFNAEGKDPRILLLSLAAGGVGLNLVGANHLFLLDMHWNPQLESQACDRIYRVGQKRPVKIHRFVTVNTVEEKILELQKKKLELADTVLTGAKRTQSSKLTLQDMKALFSVT